MRVPFKYYVRSAVTLTIEVALILCMAKIFLWATGIK